MEVTVEKPSKHIAKVQLTVPSDEFRREYRARLSGLRNQVRMKGFRPGKAPLPMIEKQHGEELRQDIQQEFLRKAYAQAVRDEELRPIAHPRVDRDQADLAEDGSFKIEFEISLRPEVDLGDYTGLVIESELEPVMDDNVEAAIEEVRRQQSKPEPASEGLLESGFAMSTVEFLHGDQTVFFREGLRLSPLSPPPGVEPEAFKDALLDQTEGAVIDIGMTLPENVEVEEARGQEGTCRVTLGETYNLVPPSEEELFTLLEVEDEAGLRAKVKERLEEAAETREQQRIETTLLDGLIQSTAIELPEPLIEEQTHGRLRSLAEELSQQGLPEDSVESQLEESKEAAREEAVKGLRALLIVETIGEKENLLVTQEDMEAELVAIAERNQAEIDEVRRYYAENNLGQQMTIELLERKVRRFLRENAEVKQPS